MATQFSFQTVLKPLMYRTDGEPTLLLKSRMEAAKYAATRGWVIPLLTTGRGIAAKWERADPDGVIGYKHYLKIDFTSEAILSQITRLGDKRDHVLDLGCNVGRELNYLWQQGYRHLTGVEIGREPIKAMREHFPAMMRESRIFNKSLTTEIRTFEDKEFDIVYAHGVLVSMSAREQFVFDEMVRIARRNIVVLENEWSLLLFPRDFGKVFEDRGLKQTYHSHLLMRKGVNTDWLESTETDRPVPEGYVRRAAVRVFEV